MSTFFKWVIPGKLAQSPMPRLSDIQGLARLFTGVVVLPEAREMHPYYLETLENHGIEALHIPTPDLHPVELLDLLRASFFIERHVGEGGAVLVHCVGGLGRSGVVTAAYLVFKGLSYYEAVARVRSAVPGSIENPWQARMVRTYEVLLKVLRDTGLLAEVAEGVGRVAARVARHASKVLQLHIELHDPLHVDDPYMKQGVKRAVEGYFSKGDGVRVEGPGDELCLPEALDHDYSGRVVTLQVDQVDKPLVTLLCRDNCSQIADRAAGCRDYVSRLLGGDPVFQWGYYLDYV
ncbi:protein-tyrosine phosphatase family protein [Desulfurococcus mucosus]|uniref:Dual specificity protein phosphatase n=1 Tax=Desulfurococcus mucosus (strain ATCC 35584 / DSM 2162 / JCM 9187 / O7/1) TaxID=765177 RepID=E8R8T7_DESM0|nr:dual specificity protein phosphatase family protein [Desulfurococcus mucosus]ADV64913.1 dual specificity protein phosphatase [Desulfurococcus mucosus DSM 2162]